jgi:hypothetical protein
VATAHAAGYDWTAITPRILEIWLMKDLLGVGKLADSKLADNIYRDGLSGATKETGEALTDVVKTFRLFLAPIQLLAASQDRLTAFCERVRAAVPPERQIEAASSIAGPVLLELRCMEDDSPITELYLNLLKRAIDQDRKDEAHPAFVKIIGQLCPDEAMILHHLSGFNIRTIQHRGNSDHKFPMSLHSVAWSDYPVEELRTSNRLVMYLDHLSGLQLVDPGYADVYDSNEFSGIEGYEANVLTYTLTEFGKMFVATCEP